MTVTEFKKGDRVRVTFVDTVWEAGPAGVSLDCGVHAWGAGHESTELISKPLEIGDVPTWPATDVDNAPDVDINTIVTDRDGAAWQKHLAGRWFSGGSMPKNSLAELARTRGPLTVRYIP